MTPTDCDPYIEEQTHHFSCVSISTPLQTSKGYGGMLTTAITSRIGYSLVMDAFVFSFSFSLGPIPASSVSQPRLYLTLSTSSTSIWPDDEHLMDSSTYH